MEEKGGDRSGEPSDDKITVLTVETFLDLESTLVKDGVAKGNGEVLSKRVQFPKSFFDDGPAFTTSPISVQLGFPVKAAINQAKKSNNINNSVTMLFHDGDIMSPTFSDRTGEFYIGEAFVMRTDGKDIHELQFTGLHEFIGITMCVYKLQVMPMPEGAKKEKAKAEIARKLTPEGFHTWFEDWRLRMIQKGDLGWRDVESPVIVTLGEVANVCGSCWRKDTAEKLLVLCAKCRKRS